MVRGGVRRHQIFHAHQRGEEFVLGCSVNRQTISYADEQKKYNINLDDEKFQDQTHQGYRKVNPQENWQKANLCT